MQLLGVDSVEVAIPKQQNPSRIQAQTCQNHPPKNCLTLLSDALKKDDANCLEWTPWKWPLRPKGTLWSTVPKQQNPSRIQAQTCQNHPPKNCLTLLSDGLKKAHPPKNCLTLLSDALKKDDATAWSGLRGSGHFVRKELCGARFLNSRTPAGFKPIPARTIPQKTA